MRRVSSKRNCEAICNVVLSGTYLAVAAISLLSLVSFQMSDYRGAGKLLVCAIAFLYVAMVQVLIRRRYYQIVAHLFIGFYLLLAAGIMWSWGINTPVGTLLLALVIVLAGILLTAKHALIAATLSGLMLIGIQTAIVFGWRQPDMSWAKEPSNFGDVAAYCVVFGMLALVSWLYSREMEQSLHHARQAEAALRKQKATLKLQVAERTEELRRAQLEEMRQLYRFTDVGQVGVALLHDLANHLTALILEIEGLQGKRHSQELARAREIIRYFEKVVDGARSRLYGGESKQTFDIVGGTSEMVSFLSYKASRAGVKLVWDPPRASYIYNGDPSYYYPVLTILIGNAIDAYSASGYQGRKTPKEQVVEIAMQIEPEAVVITITDWGRGIKPKMRGQLFKPLCSTKKTGMGVGLFITQQTVQTDFGGSIALDPRTDCTQFVIKLPVRSHGE